MREALRQEQRDRVGPHRLTEGEGELDADDLRASHIAYWTREGIAVDESTMLVLLHFELVDEA